MEKTNLLLNNKNLINETWKNKIKNGNFTLIINRKQLMWIKY